MFHLKVELEFMSSIRAPQDWSIKLLQNVGNINYSSLFVFRLGRTLRDSWMALHGRGWVWGLRSQQNSGLCPLGLSAKVASHHITPILR
jgi:hypothetical protein